MSATPVLMSLFTLGLLLPVMYRRYRRRSGAQAAGFATRRGRVLVMGMASLILVGVLGGAAMAENGDHSGTKTGTNTANLIQDDLALALECWPPLSPCRARLSF